MLIGYESSEEEVVRRRQKVTDLMMLGWKLTAWRRWRCLKPSTLKSWRFGGFCNVTFVHPYVECMLSKGSFASPSWCTASNPDLTSCLVTSGQGSNGFVMRKSWRTCREWITCQGAQRDFCIFAISQRSSKPDILIWQTNDHRRMATCCRELKDEDAALQVFDFVIRQAGPKLPVTGRKHGNDHMWLEFNHGHFHEEKSNFFAICIYLNPGRLMKTSFILMLINSSLPTKVWLRSCVKWFENRVPKWPKGLQRWTLISFPWLQLGLVALGVKRKII